MLEVLLFVIYLAIGILFAMYEEEVGKLKYKPTLKLVGVKFAIWILIGILFSAWNMNFGANMILWKILIIVLLGAVFSLWRYHFILACRQAKIYFPKQSVEIEAWYKKYIIFTNIGCYGLFMMGFFVILQS